MSERAEAVKAAFLAAAKELEANLDKSAARIRELEAQLAEANAARVNANEANISTVAAALELEARAEKAEADNAKLRRIADAAVAVQDAGNHLAPRLAALAALDSAIREYRQAALTPAPEAPPAVFPWESGDRMRAELEKERK